MKSFALIVALSLLVTTGAGCQIPLSSKRAAVTGNLVMAGVGAGLVAASTSDSGQTRCSGGYCPQVDFGGGALALTGVVLAVAGVLGAMMATSGDDERAPGAPRRAAHQERSRLVDPFAYTAAK